MTVPKFSEWAALAEQGPMPQQMGAPNPGAMGMGMGMNTPTPQQGATEPAPGATGVSAPQHMQDEESMDINAVIEKRLNMLLDELQQKRKRPKEELVQIFSAVLQQLMNMGLQKSAANTAVRDVSQGGAAAGAPGAGSATPTAQPQVSA